MELSNVEEWNDMKKLIASLMALSMLCLAGCGGSPDNPQQNMAAPTEGKPLTAIEQPAPTDPILEGEMIDIVLNGTGITAGGESGEKTGVYVSNDIVYYEDKDAYESGNPYGEGENWEKHTAEEAAAHLVVNITQPGSYRLSGELTLGQIRIDLGDTAFEDPNAVVNLILDGVDITCTVGPAILFQNVYECDGNWSVDTAQPEVDTAAAGANLILAAGSENTIYGGHVAKIYKDQKGEKKLWKQDGAIYSYMSMNVAGTGSLNLYADNEGLDTELHLTINGGNLNIYADNDGINTNEDGVSVTTINNGNLHIIAGLGAEGDGIDSNGYLVINGGTVVASANPAADAGLDSDLGSYIHGGLVIALGSAMDWAESNSDQVTMNLQFAQMQSSGSAVAVQRQDGTVVFAYDPGTDEVLGEKVRSYSGAIVSTPYFNVGESYQVFIGSKIAGSENGGMYDVITVTGREGGIQQAYSGTDVTMSPGGMGGFKPDGQMPGGMEPPAGEMPTMPSGMEPPEGDMGNRDPGDRGPMPEGEIPSMPEGEMPSLPEGELPPMPQGGQPGEMGQRPGGMGEGAPNSLFYMQDKVNFFSGLSEYTE